MQMSKVRFFFKFGHCIWFSSYFNVFLNVILIRFLALCKALWIASVLERCYANKPAFHYLAMIFTFYFDYHHIYNRKVFRPNRLTTSLETTNDSTQLPLVVAWGLKWQNEGEHTKTVKCQMKTDTTPLNQCREAKSDFSEYGALMLGCH